MLTVSGEKKKTKAVSASWMGEAWPPGRLQGRDFKLLTFYRVQAVNLNNKMAGSFWNSQSDFCYL